MAEILGHRQPTAAAQVRRVDWSLTATDTLEAIKAYIARDNPLAAERVGRRVIAATLMLADAPEIGRAAGPYRELTTVRPYIIRYRVETERVVIIRVRHGVRRPD